MNTIQPIIRKKWLELLAVAQIAILIFVVGSLQPVNSQIPPDGTVSCSVQCSGGGCSITVINHDECLGQPDHMCAFVSADCSCSCTCGTTLLIEGPEGTHYQYQAHYDNGGSCGISI